MRPFFLAAAALSTLLVSGCLSFSYSVPLPRVSLRASSACRHVGACDCHTQRTTYVRETHHHSSGSSYGYTEYSSGHGHSEFVYSRHSHGASCGCDACVVVYRPQTVVVHGSHCGCSACVITYRPRIQVVHGVSCSCSGCYVRPLKRSSIEVLSHGHSHGHGCGHVRRGGIWISIR